MVALAILMCFILILIMTAFISMYLGYFNTLSKSTWVDSPILYTILLALTLTFLTMGVFINFDENIVTVPLYFMIIFFQFIWLLSTYGRMYSTSIIIGSAIFILTSIEMILMVNSKSPELCWLASPFLFYSLVQLAITDDLYKYNVSHEDIICRKFDNHIIN